jgi:hypothetical protein
MERKHADRPRPVLSFLAASFCTLLMLASNGCNQGTQTESKVLVNTPAADSKLTSEQVQTLLGEALTELDKKNFGRSIEITLRVIKSDSGNVEAYFIESQANSMTGDVKAAVAALEQAFKNGLKDIERVFKERRFDPIRSNPEFDEMLRRNGFSSAEKMGEQEVRAGNVSIKEEAGTQVIKAGDITLRLPKD